MLTESTALPFGFSSATVAVCMSLIAGCSTALGASCVFFLPPGPIDPWAMCFSLSMAAGVMLTVSAVELLPHVFASREVTSSIIGILWSALGAVLYIGISRTLPLCTHAHTIDDVESVCAESLRSKGRYHAVRSIGRPSNVSECPPSLAEGRARAYRLSLVLMISLTAHNFPEGLAVAVSAMTNVKLGAVVMIAIMVHNVPEGIAIAIPVYAAHGSKWRAMKMATASGFSEPLGAIFAVTCLNGLSVAHLNYALSFVAGMMSAVAIGELLPEALQQSREPSALWGGLVSGAGIMIVTEHLLSE